MEDVKRAFFYDQDHHLFSIMNGCNKSAFLLPQYSCKQIARRLTRNDHRHVFIGKEVYTNVTEVFSLRGFIPNYLRWRIRGMEMSGIWKWWDSIVGHRYLLAKNVKKRFLHEKPTMAGKILVIFVVFLIGMSVATLWFIIEAYKLLLQKSRHIICLIFLTAQVCEKMDQVMKKESHSYDFTSVVSVRLYKSSKSYSKTK